jgi:hypothetical protein
VLASPLDAAVSSALMLLAASVCGARFITTRFAQAGRAPKATIAAASQTLRLKLRVRKVLTLLIRVPAATQSASAFRTLGLR